jgi:hypothetical protein
MHVLECPPGIVPWSHGLLFAYKRKPPSHVARVMTSSSRGTRARRAFIDSPNIGDPSGFSLVNGEELEHGILLKHREWAGDSGPSISCFPCASSHSPSWASGWRPALSAVSVPNLIRIPTVNPEPFMSSQSFANLLRRGRYPSLPLC